MSLFYFKAFAIDQENCPMKINTDGVLLGAFANETNTKKVLDIGTGTGVIALMLAQKLENASLTAIDIDQNATKTAARNFENSAFNSRIKAYNYSFQEYFNVYPNQQFDLIISNPPFYVRALRSNNHKINTAKHADEQFFIDLVHYASMHLSEQGNLKLIVPIELADFISHLAKDYHLNLQKKINISSFPGKAAFRTILNFGRMPGKFIEEQFVIYEREGVHTLQYQKLLKDFFIIFE